MLYFNLSVYTWVISLFFLTIGNNASINRGIAYLFEILISFHLDRYPDVRLVDHSEWVCLQCDHYTEGSESITEDWESRRNKTSRRQCLLYLRGSCTHENVTIRSPKQDQQKDSSVSHHPMWEELSQDLTLK